MSIKTLFFRDMLKALNPKSSSIMCDTLQCSKLKEIGGRQNWRRGVRGSSPEKNFKFKVAKPPEI